LSQKATKAFTLQKHSILTRLAAMRSSNVQQPGNAEIVHVIANSSGHAY